MRFHAEEDPVDLKPKKRRESGMLKAVKKELAEEAALKAKKADEKVDSGHKHALSKEEKRKAKQEKNAAQREPKAMLHQGRDPSMNVTNAKPSLNPELKIKQRKKKQKSAK